MKYAVNIKETLSKTVIVEAGDFVEAIEKVSDAYRASEIILDSDNFSSVDFDESCVFGDKPIPEDSENLKYFDFLSTEEEEDEKYIS